MMADGVFRPDLVDTVNVLLTARCNLACAYCYQGDQRQGPAHWDDLQPTLDWALRNSGNRLKVIMSGGEPLLEPRLVRKVLRYTRKHSAPGLELSYRIVTNGLLLSDEMFELLTAHEVEIRLSIDGVAAAQHERGQGTHERLDRILRTLKLIDGPAFQANMVAAMTVSPRTVPYLADGVAYLIGKGFPRIEVGPVLTACPGWDRPDRSAIRAQFARLGELCRDHLDRTGTMPLSLLHRSETSHDPSPTRGAVCNAGRNRTPVIDVDGQLYSCVLFADSVRHVNHGPANVAEATCWGRPDDPGFDRRFVGHAAIMADIPVFQTQPRRTGLFGTCAECEHHDHCFVCPLAFLGTGSEVNELRVPAFVCAFNAAAYEAREKFPALPLPAELRLQPEVLAQQDRSFMAEMDRILGRTRQSAPTANDYRDRVD